MSFPRLQELLDLTAGNLATHLRKLEDAGYVTIEKAHRGRVPVTYLSLSTTGLRAFEGLHGLPAQHPRRVTRGRSSAHPTRGRCPAAAGDVGSAQPEK